MRSEIMKTVIVDDQILFREGLVSLLDNQPDFQVIGQTGTVRGAVELATKLKPDLILLDIELPDGDGVEAVRFISAQCPETRIVMLTIYDSEDHLFAALRNGAKGFLLKNTPISNLLASLRALQRDEAALSRSMTSHVIKEFSRLGAVNYENGVEINKLTSREMEVLVLLSKNLSNREIAQLLTISTNTVKIHIHNILKKLKLRNRREAGKFAKRHGLSGFTDDSSLPNND